MEAATEGEEERKVRRSGRNEGVDVKYTGIRVLVDGGAATLVVGAGELGRIQGGFGGQPCSPVGRRGRRWRRKRGGGSGAAGAEDEELPAAEDDEDAAEVLGFQEECGLAWGEPAADRWAGGAPV